MQKHATNCVARIWIANGGHGNPHTISALPSTTALNLDISTLQLAEHASVDKESEFFRHPEVLRSFFLELNGHNLKTTTKIDMTKLRLNWIHVLNTL